MIKSVEFSGTSDNPYKIQLVKPDPELFTISPDGIEGLGAGKAQLHTSERASLDGNVFNGARLGARNLVFNLGYGHKLNPEVGRDISYDVFPLKEKITMRFETDLKTVTIDGYIESNEPSIFTNEPSFDVSILCTDPYFRSVPEQRTVTKLYSLIDKFDFPFSNESVTEELLELGEHAMDRFAELRYLGSVPSGVIIRFMFNGTATHPSIVNERTGQTLRIDTGLLTSLTGRALGAGDVIEINTIRGQKSVTLIRDAKRINVLNAFATASKWIELRKGINPISVYADTGINSFQTEIIHDSLYSGL